MEELKCIKDCLVSQVKSQCNDLKKVNTKELGEVIDMVKDLEEAIYYCSITDAMERTSEDKKRYYDDSHSDYRSASITSDDKYYVPYMEYAPYMMRDEEWRNKHFYDGRSMTSRRMYMEGKQEHKNDQQSMQDLERYVKDLSDDMIDMIKESSNEEKQILSTKLQQLASKVNAR